MTLEEAGVALDGAGREPDAVLGERHEHRAVVDGDAGRDQVHRGAADERCHEQVRRREVQLLRRCHLLEDAVAHDRHAVTHRHRLHLVVGDVHHRGAEASLQLDDVGAHLDAELGVEVRQRLVHQEHPRRAHDGAAHRHPLTLPARQRLGEPVEVLGEPEHLGGVLDATLRLGLVHLGDLEGEPDVLAHGHVRVERVVLEDHGDVAVAGRQVVDDLVVDAQLTVGDLLEPGEHPQRGRLAAPGGPDEHHELTVRDVEVESVDGLRSVLVALGDLGEGDC